MIHFSTEAPVTFSMHGRPDDRMIPVLSGVAYDGEGYTCVGIHPTSAFPAVDDVVQKLKRDNGVDVDHKRFAVIEFKVCDQSGVQSLGVEAADRWCRDATRMGWHIWLLSNSDGLPPIEIAHGEGLGRFSGHDLPLKLFVFCTADGEDRAGVLQPRCAALDHS
jgi:hypothetical protein